MKGDVAVPFHGIAVSPVALYRGLKRLHISVENSAEKSFAEGSDRNFKFRGSFRKFLDRISR